METWVKTEATYFVDCTQATGGPSERDAGKRKSLSAQHRKTLLKVTDPTGVGHAGDNHFLTTQNATTYLNYTPILARLLPQSKQNVPGFP